MVTCKDCVYFDVCSALNPEFKKYPKDYIDSDLCAKQCTTFKDRTRFVELPCKVGDFIFIIKRTRGMFVRAAKVDSITITRSGRIQVSCYRSSFIGFWGVDAFATEEEAEHFLKEREANANDLPLKVEEIEGLLECDDCSYFKDRSRFVELPDYKYSAEERFRGAVQELIDIAKASETPSKILQATSESLAHFACELSKLEETKQTLKERGENEK